jgi:hypothetical protein
MRDPEGGSVVKAIIAKRILFPLVLFLPANSPPLPANVNNVNNSVKRLPVHPVEGLFYTGT